MSWIEVRAFFDPFPLDPSPVIEVFRDFGVQNTQEDGPSLIGCITDVPGAVQVANDLAAALHSTGAAKVLMAPLPEGDWERIWKQFFKPRRVGPRFVIQPTWERSVAGPEDIELLLDPGMAFGTGDHPTTRMCLELLGDLDLTGKAVLDVGCGSGILSIAAAKMGAIVTASDVDPIAVEVTTQNAARNQVQIQTRVGDGLTRSAVPDLASVPQDETALREFGGAGVPKKWKSIQPREAEYSLILSNIISATLIRLSKDVSSALLPGGGWIVSGIIDTNWREVLRAAEVAEFALVEERSEDGWVAARFMRREIGE